MTIFKIQTKNIFKKRNITVFLFIGLIIILLMHEGNNKYSNLLENKNVFKELESEKVKNYVYYDQYGGYGMKILYIPPPFIIFHSDFNFDDIVANVNIGERLNLCMTLNEGFSIENSGFMDVLGIILIFSVIASLICGYEITNKYEYFKVLSRQYSCGKIFLKSVISNIIIINFAFLLLIVICTIWLLINGINLFDMPLVYVALSVILVTSFFLSIGTIIGGINKEKSTKVTILSVLIILFVLFIPWFTYKINKAVKDEIESIRSVELKNMKILMAAERRALKKIGIYKNDGKKAPEDVTKIVEEDQKNDFKKIEENEARRINDVLNRIKGKQSLLSFFPITFVISMNMEISGFGGRSYIEFYLFSKKIKQYFKNFIIRKKIYEGAKPGKVESFISKDDDKNVFYAKSRLPFNFWLGVFLTPFYAILLLFFSFRAIKKRQKIPEAKKAYQLEKGKDNPLFVLCENEEIKTDIFNYYQNQKNSLCLEKIDTGDFRFNGVKPHELFSHLCLVSGIDEKKAVNNLVLMGIKDLAGLPFSEEIIYKIYAAVLTASEFDFIVINDFVKKESRKFENDFFSLLLSLEKSGKKILYLSTQMQQTSDPFIEDIKINGFKEIPLDFTDTSLR